MSSTEVINIISIDIGIKNLAICKLRLVNLFSDEDLVDKTCSKPILQIKYWNVINIMKNTIQENEKSRAIPVEIIISQLTNLFWNELMPILCQDKIDHVVIERQMNTTEMAYYAYVLQSLFNTCVYQKSPRYKIGNFSFQNAKKKFGLIRLWPHVNYNNIKKYDLDELNRLIEVLEEREYIKNEMDKIADYNGIKFMGQFLEKVTKFKKIRATKTQDPYTYNKKLSVVITKMLLIHYNLEEDEIYLENVKNKKDDLCDAFNIGYFELIERGYIKNHKYIVNKKRKRN